MQRNLIANIALCATLSQAIELRAMTQAGSLSTIDVSEDIPIDGYEFAQSNSLSELTNRINSLAQISVADSANDSTAQANATAAEQAKDQAVAVITQMDRVLLGLNANNAAISNIISDMNEAKNEGKTAYDALETLYTQAQSDDHSYTLLQQHLFVARNHARTASTAHARVNSLNGGIFFRMMSITGAKNAVDNLHQTVTDARDACQTALTNATNWQATVIQQDAYAEVQDSLTAAQGAYDDFMLLKAQADAIDPTTINSQAQSVITEALGYMNDTANRVIDIDNLGDHDAFANEGATIAETAQSDAATKFGGLSSHQATITSHKSTITTRAGTASGYMQSARTAESNAEAAYNNALSATGAALQGYLTTAQAEIPNASNANLLADTAYASANLAYTSVTNAVDAFSADVDDVQTAINSALAGREQAQNSQATLATTVQTDALTRAEAAYTSTETALTNALAAEGIAIADGEDADDILENVLFSSIQALQSKQKVDYYVAQIQTLVDNDDGNGGQTTQTLEQWLATKEYSHSNKCKGELDYEQAQDGTYRMWARHECSRKHMYITMNNDWYYNNVDINSNSMICTNCRADDPKTKGRGRRQKVEFRLPKGTGEWAIQLGTELPNPLPKVFFRSR